ncbi:hypothetical protein SAMN02745121_02409 [Nannocystis exedens]|uniref:Uncharacterized protein n=1 Tax=Nannocystis exedens TaxID=54 RepID=A0A1I1WJ87_9BACT|nr:hypothetical protein [Nannocystis exedens]PCC67773.1 hypothetical protein NAEX_00781 [Nannocystis exedens]SFD95142.1 hypothetical protein SAMN02745121_02409 [Nannocystis exedens]
MSRPRRNSLANSALGALVLVTGCRPAPAAVAAPPGAAAATERSVPRVPPRPRTSIDLCADPGAAFASYRWLPNEVFTLVTVRPDDPALATSLRALDARATNAFGDAALAFPRRFAGELPQVRALLARAGLRPEEVVFLAANDAEVWAAPRLCGADAMLRAAAALDLRVREVEAPLAAVIARPAAASGYALLQLASGGPLWIVQEDRLGRLHAWLAALSGDPGEYYAEWLREPERRGTLRVLDTDPIPPDASEVLVCVTTRRLVVTGADVDIGTEFSEVYVSARKPGA